MEENNTNFSDFFKKKLGEAEHTGDNKWDKPNPSVKRLVLQNISDELPTAASTSFNVAKWFFVATSIALLLMGGSIFYLHNQNKSLKNQVATEANESFKKLNINQLNRLQQENEMTYQKITEENNKTLTQKLNQQKNELAQVNNRLTILTKQNEQCASNEASYQKKNESINNLNQQLKDCKNQIAQLQSINENLNIQIADLAIKRTVGPSLTNSKLGSSKKQEGKNQHISSLTILNTTLASSNSIELSAIKKAKSIFSKKHKRKRFEIGYTHSITRPDIWIESSLEDQDGVAEIYYDLGSYSKIGYKGFRIGFSPSKHLWINSGFSTYSTTVSNLIEMDVKYNSKGEVYTADKKVRNQLSLTTKTGYVETTNPLYFEFNIGELLENDDIQVLVNDVQNLNFLRVPLGIQYHFGKKRIKGFVEGGFLFSKVSGNQYIQTTIFSDNAAISSLNSEEPQLLQAQAFLQTYAGMGLNYRIFKNFHARAGVNVNTKFIEQNYFYNSLASNFDLGLYYRF